MPILDGLVQYADTVRLCESLARCAVLSRRSPHGARNGGRSRLAVGEQLGVAVGGTVAELTVVGIAGGSGAAGVGCAGGGVPGGGGVERKWSSTGGSNTIGVGAGAVCATTTATSNTNTVVGRATGGGARRASGGRTRPRRTTNCANEARCRSASGWCAARSGERRWGGNA